MLKNKILISCIFISCYTFCQEKHSSDIVALVFKKNHIGKVYHFNDKEFRVKVTYLGIICAKKQPLYKIITVSSVARQQNKRGRSEILLYDTLNKYVGTYRLDGPELLPKCVKNNELIVIEDGKECSIIPDFEVKKPQNIYLRRGSIVDTSFENAIGHYLP